MNVAANNKQSILIENQFPEFVQEDYPTFIRFVEAYYEFLETKMSGQKNDLNLKSRELMAISDVDENLDEFEEQFFKIFLELFPRDTLASKSLLIKNAVPLYLSKGNEKAIKYFFRALFDEEINIQIPRNDVLIASGGLWKIVKVLRTLRNVYSRHIAGVDKYKGVSSNTTFYLPQEVTIDDVTVYVDDILQTVNYWQLENAKYTGKYFSSPYGLPRQIYFRPEGTEIFVMDDTTAKVYKHRLTDAWNIQSTSATSIEELDLVSLGSSSFVVGLDFKSDGTRMYHAQFGVGSNRILEYHLSESWNLQSASRTSSTFYVAVADGTRDVKFDETGTYMYVVNAPADRIYQFTLSTPWSVNTASLTGSFITTTIDVAPTGLYLKPDGTLAYLTGETNNRITSLNLSTAWDITTASIDKTFTPSVGETISYMLSVKPEGDILYYGGTGTDAIYQFKLEPDYYIQKEYKKIVFPNSLTKNSVVKIYYSDFDYSLIENRKITGNNSGAYAIVENAHSYENSEIEIFEFEIDEKTKVKEFINGEDYISSVLDPDDGLIDIRLPAFSGLNSITIIDEGSSYNVGDPVILIGGDYIESAQVAVSKVFSGFLNQMSTIYGGAGFLSGFPVVVTNIGSSTIVAAIVDVDKTGANTPNTFVFGRDLIYDLGSTTISTANYRTNGCFKTVTGSPINVNSRMIDVFNYSTFIDLGDIKDVLITTSTATTNLLAQSIVNAAAANISVSNNRGIFTSSIPIDSFGSIGRIDVLTRGSGYQAGDKVNFTNTQRGLGIGAKAAITEVDVSGGIKKVELQPHPPSPNCLFCTIQTGSNSVVGDANSKFAMDFKIGQEIMIFNQRRTITQIASNTLMNVSSSFITSKSNTEIGLYDVYPIGGQGYTQSELPYVTIQSATGTGAVLAVTSIMGDGEILSLGSDKKPGGIEEVIIINPGSGYKIAPIVDFSRTGDGQATGVADINDSYYEYEGKYLSTAGHLSSDKKLQDSSLFNTGSYILKTKQQFSKFKSSFLKLLHPSGTISYCSYTPNEEIIVSTHMGDSEIESEIQTLTYQNVSTIVANNRSTGKNSFVIFSGGGEANVTANARIVVNTAGYITEVTVLSGGAYTYTPTARANTGNSVLTITMI